MQHPLYARCYDRDLNGKYVRPQQIWDNEEGLDAFQELKALGVTEKDKMEGLEKNLQAHHIITVNEMENNDFLFKKLPYLGYNLNDWHNIVVLPGIPELACFYEMPLDSGSHPTPYTDNVKRRLSLLRNAILGSKYCNENDSKALELIVKEMQQHSLDVYKQITQFRRMGFELL
ncbi:AHH domain-containing protein [Vibrio atlanticus]|uniref:AHH domain-containing protein n=1 Tax=Vibrio atlanticus TaxID=693153 RepID=UPI00216671AE|nr:AHH domain-containing protein [Vibrio atlanticus]